MKTEIVSQYKASLKMLMKTIEKCPDELWDNASYSNAYWRIVYHALFYTHLYLSESDSQFEPWVKHKPNHNFLGTVSFDKKPIVITESYLKTELTDYAKAIFECLDDTMTDANLTANSGFSWIPMNKFELHLYNIRHLQHHTGQLIERLHHVGITGIGWVGTGNHN